ncbi:MAG: glycosyltransferase, partial [Chloroflexota bacterium]
MSSFDLSLLIPAYNESQRISPALDRIIEYLRAQTYSWELLIVDDGSRDETASLVAKRIEGITNAKL